MKFTAREDKHFCEIISVRASPIRSLVTTNERIGFGDRIQPSRFAEHAIRVTTELWCQATVCGNRWGQW